MLVTSTLVTYNSATSAISAAVIFNTVAFWLSEIGDKKSQIIIYVESR